MAGKFKAGLKAAKNLEGKPTSQPGVELENQETIKPENQYLEEDLKMVNVGGFKVPAIVRQHWQIEAKRQKLPVSRLLKQKLIEQYGLPAGISEIDLRPS